MNVGHLAVALVIGVLAGAHTSTWGMYKDAVHEGFTAARYSRSILISGTIALLLQLAVRFDLSRASQMIVLFGLVYALERLVTEFWKTFLRNEDQSKYFIPMQFHVLGKVQNRRTQLVAGAAWLAAVVLILFGILQLQAATEAGRVSRWLAVAIAGSIGGWVAAFGGAWKDAPLEGFEWFKFFRSPVTALIYGLIVAHFTDSLIIIALAAEGFTVATLETYKTFFFPDKPRGKWAGKPINFPHMLDTRKHFRTVYIGIWVAILATYAVAFSEPRTGLLSIL